MMRLIIHLCGVVTGLAFRLIVTLWENIICEFLKKHMPEKMQNHDEKVSAWDRYGTTKKNHGLFSFSGNWIGTWNSETPMVGCYRWKIHGFRSPQKPLHSRHVQAQSRTHRTRSEAGCPISYIPVGSKWGTCRFYRVSVSWYPKSSKSSRSLVVGKTNGLR